MAAIKASLEKHLAEHSVRVLFEVRALAVTSEIQAVHDRYTELSDAFCHFGLDMESWDEANLQAAVQIARRNAARKSATQPFWSAILQITKAYQLQRQQERTGSGAWKVTVDILADSPMVFGVPSHWEARCDGKAEAILALDRKLADLPPEVRLDAFVEWAIGPVLIRSDRADDRRGRFAAAGRRIPRMQCDQSLELDFFGSSCRAHILSMNSSSSTV